MAAAAGRFDAAIAAGVVFSAASSDLVPTAATACPRKITIYPSGLDDGVGTGGDVSSEDTACP